MFASMVARSPEDVALDRLQARHMLEEADRLAVNERSVLLLRAQGEGAADVARELGLSYKSVESAYTRARRKLRAAAAVTAALAAAALRHALRGTSTASAMAATAVALVALGTTGDRAPGNADTTAPGAHDERVQRIAHDDSSATVAPGASVAHTVANLAGRGAGASRAGAAAAPPPNSSPPAVSTQQVIAVELNTSSVNAPASVSRHHDGRSFTQALGDCVAQGVSLDPHHLGCP
jgi:DNA-binding CsgD family transcriptional regulator